MSPRKPCGTCGATTVNEADPIDIERAIIRKCPECANEWLEDYPVLDRCRNCGTVLDATNERDGKECGACRAGKA